MSTTSEPDLRDPQSRVEVGSLSVDATAPAGAAPAGGGRKRRRRARTPLVIVSAVVVAAAAGAAVAVGADGRTGGTAANGGLPPATAQVTRQTLVDSESFDGELGYGATRSATLRTAGTLTSLAATGSQVTRGKPLFAVDNAKVVLLYGSLPAYRTLGPGMSGADVRQFEKNLKALGYTGFTADDEYTSATADAVRRWQEDLGLPETGRVELGQVVYADGAVRVDSHKADVGDPAQPGQAVLTYTGTARVVTVSLAVDDERLAKRGAKVNVSLPNGKDVTGTITNTETVIEAGSSGAGGASDPETKIEVTVTVADPKALTGFEQASAKVAFTAAERRDVLTVPVAALLALAEGGYGVQLVEGSATRIVAVETGLFASGRVEVSGAELAEGATVGMPT
ncbi:HlyD family secretion protein [Micromonospora eburnea]|uniref:HlyD family secretion protein n=1 Tax=Micromonospora eburnea TaxID=227316 RepID=A0A1C6TUY6_9ACTN|nr:peptidoglycan-binding domain-containing protein [Micromonospora eburnea]SCL45632.1 HlyD family secretion protein [Micromonospora eburnea]